jgi:cytoskeletal protein CcmA (bactofilin family)
MEKRDLRISGASVATGGEYRDVKVSGASKITSDISCETMSISGAITVEGNVDATTCKISGACKVRGYVRAEEIKISGGSTIGEFLEGNEISLSGGIKVHGDIRSNHLKLSGEITVDGDMECEEFYLNGAMTSKRTVNCEKCELKIVSSSSLGELVGSEIVVKESMGSGGFLKNLFGGGGNHLKVTLVEGDDIYLENTIAEVVRGAKVTLGPGCRVEKVEYSEKLEVHKDAKVTERVEL